MNLMELLEVEAYGSTLLQWAFAAGITTAIVLLAALAKPLLLRRLGAATQRTRMGIDDALVAALAATRLVLIAVVAINVGSRALELAANAQKLVDGAAAIAFFVQVGMWASALLEFWVARSQQRSREAQPVSAASLSAVGFVGRLVLWTLIALLALDNLGINITTLIAGLGIGGIAVALAVQSILGDLFASLSIVVDKPFVIGDFIIVDEFMGTVEHIGMKTTRLRSLDGEQIIFSNGDLLKTRMRNYKRMYERRIVFPFRVRYDTTPEQLARIPAIVRRLVEGHKDTRFERSHFFKFGESSFDFETVFWMTTPDYNVYMDMQQQLNLDLLREFAKLGIEFALPTKAVVSASDDEDVAARQGDGQRPSRDVTRQ